MIVMKNNPKKVDTVMVKGDRKHWCGRDGGETGSGDGGGEGGKREGACVMVIVGGVGDWLGRLQCGEGNREEEEGG